MLLSVIARGFLSRSLPSSLPLRRSTTSSACEIVNKLQGTFEKKQISEPLSSAEFIVAHACGEKTYFHVDPERTLSCDAIKHVKSMEERRLESEPIQYIVGDWDFTHLTLLMHPPVFIPRPETEELVQLILSEPGIERSLKFLEIGCGSGAISLSLLSKLPKCTALALDQSLEACDLTKENARLVGVEQRISVLNHRLKNDSRLRCHDLDFIVSNPPYIPSKQMQDLAPDITRHEDLAALEGGPDGLDVINIILNHSRHLLKPGGLLWLEVDTSHAEKLRKICEENSSLQLKFVKSYDDFRNLSRFCKLKFSSS